MNDRDELVGTSAARALRESVAKDISVSAAMPDLERGMASRNPEIRAACSWIIKAEQKVKVPTLGM